MQPSPEPIAPDQFGPYEVYERLGLGGMATVCRAKKRGPAGFERSVALKRMLSNLSEDRTFVESFIREAKVSSLLVHPNIAQVYDFGRINGTYYIAMELVPGFDLRKLLRYANRAGEAIPLAVVLSILGEMCDALEYAHTCLDETGAELRIVHRDISPSNIIVAHTGHTKVIDFGIAKANSRQLHTESGQVKGKLGYMSPEAALGMPIGPVSDVFSMGVVAWELVTASPLFSARSDFETMRKIREQEVAPPSTHNPSVPPELDRLIMSALVREDSRRLASAAQFRRGLDAVAAQQGIHVGVRAVAEWMGQFVQPEDYVRVSGGRLPTEANTSVLLPSQKAKLQRSHDEIALAAEIWGEDAGPNSIASGPDFSVENPNALKNLQVTANYATPQRAPLPLPQPPPSFTNLPAAAPAGYMPSSMQQIMPYAVPQQARPATSRKWLLVLLLLGVIAAVLLIVLLNKKSDAPVKVAEVKIDAGVAIVPKAAIVPAAPVVQQPPVAIAQPKPIATAPRPHGHDKQKHVAVVDPEPPAPKPPEMPTPTPTPPVPDPVVTAPVPPTPIAPEPAKPTRTPVVAATAVTKLSGDLPVMHGDHDGDVLVKMCIDESGKVTSAKIVKTSPDMPNDLVGALQRWSYKPFVKDGKAQPVCFALSLRVVVKNEN